MFYSMEKTWRLNRGKLSSRAPQGICLGNSIPEYAVIALFLIFISLAGIQLLSANLNTAMAKVRDDMKTHQQAAQSVLAADQAAAAAAASGSSGMGAGLTAAQLALLQQSLADKVQTTGANGATELLAQQLASAAALLLAEGKISTTQYDILMQLSNQGHKMAEIESLIQNAITSTNGNKDLYNNLTIYYNGQSYTPDQLAAMLGLNGPHPEDFATTNILNVSATDPTAEAEMSNFLSLYQQALSSGALSDPAVASTVNSAATQIASLGEVVENSSHFLTTGEMSIDAATVNVVIAQQASSMDSSTICTVGSFQDNGLLCTP
jgi:hypothetical protein